MPNSNRTGYRNPWSWLTRREFFAASSLGAVGMLSADEFGTVATAPRHVFRVRRDRDLLDLEIEFVNFREVGGHSLRSAAAGRSRIIVHFPPQNLAEAIFDEVHKDEVHKMAEFEVDLLVASGGNANLPEPPVRSYMSGPSRIVFVVPEGVVLPFTRTPNASVVDLWLQKMAAWDLYVPPEFGQRTYQPRPPRWDETCLELPYRLFIAPRTGKVRWLSSAERLPFAAPTPGISELWNAQLISRVKLDPAKPSEDVAKVLAIDPNLAPLTDVSLQAKALYSPDYRTGADPGFGEFFPGNQELSLHSLTRHRLVKQMSQANGWIDIDHLVLTALGSDAFLAYFNQKSFAQIIQEQLDPKAKILSKKQLEDKEASLKQPGPNTELVVFKHRVVLGRDVYFIEAYFGVLFPMVYPSLYVELTQRKFAARKHDDPKIKFGPPGAYLLKRRYIVVTEPAKYFTGSDNALGRGMPIKSAILGMTKSPDLHKPELFPIDADLDGHAPVQDYGIDAVPENRPLLFVPRPINESNPKPLEWPITFTDESGRTVRTPHATLLFASNVIMGQRAWDHLKTSLREWVVPPQPLALAPETADLPIGADRARYTLTANEHEGVSRLGEAIQKWHRLIDLQKNQVDLKKTFAQNAGVKKALPYFATLEAAFRELPAVWTGTEKELESLYKSLPFQSLDQNSHDEILKKIEEAKAKIRDGFDVAGHIRTTAKQIQSSLQSITEATTKELDKTIKTFTGPADEALSNLHARMREVEKISSIFETHKITLGSAITDGYFKNFVNKLSEANIQNLAEFTAKCGQLVAELERQEFASIVRLIKRDVDVIEHAGKEAYRLAKRYVADLVVARDKAQQLGAHQFHAVMEQIEGIVPSMKAMMPNYPLQKFVHLPEYVAKGIDYVENGIFARLVQEEADIKALVEKPLSAIKNGLGTPRTLIQGLSNRLGAVAAENLEQLKKLANPLIKKIDDFKNAIPNSKLFGAIDLKDLIGTIAKGQVPSINLVKTPEKLSHSWKWTLPIDDGGTGKSFFGILTYRNFPAQKPIQVCLNINIVTTTTLPKPQQALDGERPKGTVRLDAYMGHWDIHRDIASPPPEETDPAKCTSFSLSLLDMIVIYFRQVRIEADYLVGQTPKPRIKPEIVKVGFEGPLQFVSKLQSYLGNLGGGFRLALTPKFIELSYGFLVPPISFGAFSLRNLLFQAGLMLPFADDPLRFRFNVSSFAVPFELSVLCFGGRGFLSVEIDTRGGRTLEGALEFGGNLAFDVGVASGGLFVQAGIYFKITQSQTNLSGYLRAAATLMSSV